MIICGLQKMTLLDYPGRVACTVFLGGCNFRCPYCHNYEIVSGPLTPEMTVDDFLRFLDKRHGLLDGVAVTGGEPCLQPDLPDLLETIQKAGFPVKLDTNGSNPAMLKRLLDGGLVNYVAMDIKNSPEKYAQTAGLARVDLAPIRESVRLLMTSGIEYEFRTTVVDELHTAKDIEAIGQWISGASRYCLQPFTDRETVPFEGFHAPAPERLEEYLGIIRPYVAQAAVRGA